MHAVNASTAGFVPSIEHPGLPDPLDGGGQVKRSREVSAHAAYLRPEVLRRPFRESRAEQSWFAPGPIPAIARGVSNSCINPRQRNGIAQADCRMDAEQAPYHE